MSRHLDWQTLALSPHLSSTAPSRGSQGNTTRHLPSYSVILPYSEMDHCFFPRALAQLFSSLGWTPPALDPSVLFPLAWCSLALVVVWSYNTNARYHGSAWKQDLTVMASTLSQAVTTSQYTNWFNMHGKIEPFAMRRPHSNQTLPPLQIKHREKKNHQYGISSIERLHIVERNAPGNL